MEKILDKNIFLDWLYWHFYEMPKFLVEVWNNYLGFALNYFSFVALIKNFFAPWRRYKWFYPKNFDVVGFLSTFVSNAFSRVLGAMMRIVLIIIGVLFQIFVVLAGAVILSFWIFLPILILAGFAYILLF